jgi:hypothetical protein
MKKQNLKVFNNLKYRMAKQLSLCKTMGIAFLMMALMTEQAHAAQSIFDQISTINSKLPVIKTLIIYVLFIVGIGAMGWGAMDMFKKSKRETAQDVTWMGILYKFVGGGILAGLTLFSDTMQMTIFNQTTSAPSNVSQLEPYAQPLPVPPMAGMTVLVVRA